MPDNPRGLIFCPELVPGVMSGAITVTTRIIKPQPEGSATWLPALSAEPWLYFPDCSTATPRILRCPFRVGQVRYVKEAFRELGSAQMSDGSLSIALAPGRLIYRADGHAYDGPWRSPMTMPRWAARTWVEILSVKPARCQEITEEEAYASGATDSWPLSGLPYLSGHGGRAVINNYAALWDGLNARRGFPFSGNWWTYRLIFRLTEAPC